MHSAEPRIGFLRCRIIGVVARQLLAFRVCEGRSAAGGNTVCKHTNISFADEDEEKPTQSFQGDMPRLSTG